MWFRRRSKLASAGLISQPCPAVPSYPEVDIPPHHTSGPTTYCSAADRIVSKGWLGFQVIQLDNNRLLQGARVSATCNQRVRSYTNVKRLAESVRHSQASFVTLLSKDKATARAARQFQVARSTEVRYSPMRLICCVVDPVRMRSVSIERRDPTRRSRHSLCGFM